MRYSYTMFLVLMAIAVQAQISFSNQTNLLNNSTSFHSGVAVAVADMNGDGLDDVVRLGNGSLLSIEYQTAPNQPFTNYTHGEVPEDAWAMVVGDVNNDGKNDILAGGAYDGVKVLTNNGGTFTSAELANQQGTFVQGSNFADINNDGWLDVFTCHDDGESRIWGNTGTGAFILHDEWIDMSTTPPSDNSGNYGSTWTDFDNDRDLDLYIAKCRQGVDNVNDPRRINALFVNDGQSHYTEQAGKYGLKIQWQSWTCEFQDIDNDGDMDCLVTNHDHSLQLLENDGSGHFTEITAAAGVDVSGYFIQGLMRDFDNDGFMDIITVGNFSSSAVATHLFHNNGDNTFTQINDPFGSPSIGTLATGDLNQDGFLDIYAAYQTSFNNPNSSTPDRLWMNTTNNGNNYIAFDLKGSESNRMGVGARIEIHGSWGIQIREVRAGESYGIQNSLTSYFGIGTNTEVEYAVVHWPSGKMDVIKNPPINQKNTVTEGTTCALSSFQLGNSNQMVLCPGASLTVSAPAGYEYLWNNGLVGQSITISTPGNYSVVIVDAQGCAAASDVLAVIVNPDETPTVSLTGDDKICQGASVVLTSSAATSYTWSNGAATQSISVTETGDYTVTIEGSCGNFSSQAVHVEVLPSPAPVANDVNLSAPGSATLEATGENVFWYNAPAATTPISNGPTYVTPILSTTTTFYAEDAHSYGGDIFETGMPEHQGTNFYNGASFNGQTLFEVYQPVTLKQVTLGTDQPGIRLIELLTEAGEPLDSAWVDVPIGVSVADLNFEIQPGSYRLATNTDNNIAVLGTSSPRLYRSNEGVAYPYTVQDVMSITDSDLGAGFYYYFYDWQVEAVPQVCVSERIPVVVTVGANSVGEQLPFGRLTVQPNPSSGLFYLELAAIESGETDLRITDIAGRIAFTENFEATANLTVQRKIDLTKLPAGMYFLQITSGQRSGFAKIVVE